VLESASMNARCCLLVLAFATAAQAKPLAIVGHVTVADGVIDDAFALDDGGRTLAWIETTGSGSARMHIGPATGGAGQTVDLTDFTVAPERIYFVGGQWFVVANEGERRSAAVVAGHKLGAQIGPFGDALVDGPGHRFVTVTARGSEGAERSFTVAAYRPGGGLIAQKKLSIGAEGEIAGSPGLAFIGFTDSYLRALVKKPGVYDRRTDARGPAQIAVYDVLAGRVGPARAVPDLSRLLDFTVKRAERPGAELFVRRDDSAQGLELVGPAEKLRPLVLPAKLGDFEPTAIVQQALGGRVMFSLVRDGITDQVQASGKKGPRMLALFVTDGAAKVTALGEVPIDEGQDCVWAAGGNRIAVLRKTQANAGIAIDVYQR
jgi:hypothetical protein